MRIAMTFVKDEDAKLRQTFAKLLTDGPGGLAPLTGCWSPGVQGRFRFERRRLPARQTIATAVKPPEPAGCVMSFDNDPNSPFDPPLRPGEAAASDAGDVRVFVMLPALDVLLQTPAFGRPCPISVPDNQRPTDGWTQFGSVRARGFTVH
jgi:hypothetical protein